MSKTLTVRFTEDALKKVDESLVANKASFGIQILDEFLVRTNAEVYFFIEENLKRIKVSNDLQRTFFIVFAVHQTNVEKLVQQLRNTNLVERAEPPVSRQLHS